jgi:kinesin family member 13
VFDKIGKSVLDNAWQGYHTCLFAYGQTGSGKSHSMIGYGANKGIVPLATDEIFNRIKANTDPEKSFEVTAMMCEIYNEKVQDLMIPVAKRPQAGLKVRESKVLGVFVDGLSKHAVSSFEEIEKVMQVGESHRSKGATLMNAESSRAHTVIQIEFRAIITF